MKKISIILTAILALTCFTACGLGNSTTTSGRTDQAYVCVLDSSSHPVTIQVDDTQYDTQSINRKRVTKRKNTKLIPKHAVAIPTGKHTLKVYSNGQEVYNKVIFISTNETRRIEL